MQIELDEIYDGKVTHITKFGAFVSLPGGKTGMIHISDVSTGFVKDINDFLKENDEIKVKVFAIDAEGRINLKRPDIEKAPTFKREPKSDRGNDGVRGGRFERKPALDAPARPPASIDWNRGKSDNTSFEDLMNKFKKESDEKIGDLKKTTDVKRSNHGRKDTYNK